jgi:phosphoglycolate phosphatase
MMTRPRGILFDLDGTLLNTLEDLADSVNLVLRECGLPEHPVDAYRYFVGDGASVLISRVLPENHSDPPMHARCLARFREVYAVHWNQKTRPYDGIIDLLEYVHGLGIRMAVLSNKPHDATVQCVAELLKPATFDVVQGQQEGIVRKPDPGGALSIAGALQIAVRDWWYVGDTATDMQTATAAGMFAIGVAWGFRERDELLKNGAQIILETPRDLLTLVKESRSA